MAKTIIIILSLIVAIGLFAWELLTITRNEIEKELPHWERAPLGICASTGTSLRFMETGNYLEVEGYMISVKELLNKLPKEG